MTLIAFGAFAALSTAKLLAPRQADCTQTLPATPCCSNEIAGQTSTSYTDCAGCAIVTGHNDLCDIIRCHIKVTTNFDLTDTVTSCAPSPTADVPVGDPGACTTTTTVTTDLCGDCGVVYDQTATDTVDCGGCNALATSTTTETGAGVLCICPTGPVTTVAECLATPTPL